MRQNRFRRCLRHVLALVFAVMFLVSLFMRSNYMDTTDTITRWDRWTQIAANYIGDASFACTGSLAAGMEGMDLLGCTIVGFITALGGGTFRSVVLGDFPIWWMTNGWDEFFLVVATGSLTFFAWPPVSRRLRLTSTGEWLFWTDTLGVGVFAASGAAIAAERHPDVHLIGCACCGMFTATTGGVIRDVLIGRPPRILYSTLELYATTAFLGGLACASWLKFFSATSEMEAILLGLYVTIHARVFAVNHDLRLPTFPAKEIFSKDSRPRDAAEALRREEELAREAQTMRRHTSALNLAGLCDELETERTERSQRAISC